eukprot:6574547-Lingulodinium_polyedra.AAC.1
MTKSRTSCRPSGGRRRSDLGCRRSHPMPVRSLKPAQAASKSASEGLGSAGAWAASHGLSAS